MQHLAFAGGQARCSESRGSHPRLGLESFQKPAVLMQRRQTAGTLAW